MPRGSELEPDTDKAPRRSQQERSDATRTALLDAAIASLVDVGYAGTTTAVVAERAGVSRGAHLHHFGTRDALLAAAVEHLNVRVVREAQTRAAAIPDGPERTARVLDLLWDLYMSDLFRAILELWVAARRDEQLAAALEPAEVSIEHMAAGLAVSLFPSRVADPKFAMLLSYVRAAIRGLALQEIITPSTGDGAALWPYVRTQLLRAFDEH